MNREKAQEIFAAYGKPQFKAGNSVISFSRQTESDLEDIEKKSDEELINHWKALVYMNEIMGNVSLNELQRISLIELEFDERTNIDTHILTEWFDKEMENYDESIFYK